MNADGAERQFSSRDETSRDGPVTAQVILPASLTWKTAGGFMAAYTALLLAGYALQASPAEVTTVWPSDGLLFATLLLLRKRDWPWIILVACAADVVVNRLTPGG